MTPGHLHIQRIVETGRIDPDAERHLVQALTRWDRDGGDGAALLRYLGTPTTAAKRRLASRDFWLCAAADLLGGPTTNERARRLAAAADRFERRLWPIWRDLREPPEHAHEVDGALFYARRAASLPASDKQYQRILVDAF